MSYEIIYHEAVVKIDIPLLGATEKARIKKAIEAKLSLRPEVFGKPLRKSIKGYWSLRIGDFRVIYKIASPKVKIFLIRHRSEVYEFKNSGRLG